MRADNSFIFGSASMLILKLLSEKDMYGYEMIDTLRKRSQNVFELKAGTLYPLLHSMEEKNYVETYEQEAAGKLRRYYHLTKKGKRQLNERADEWAIYSRAITNIMAGMTCSPISEEPV